MTEILLVRHAETDLKGTFCGHSDPPLNNAGRAQLPAILDAIGNRPLEIILSSDLLRARQTAEVLAQHYGAKLLLRPGLREIFFGEWEGLRWEQIEERDPSFARAWMKSFPSLTPPGGESILDFEARIRNELLYMSELARDSAVIVVTHAGVMRAMLKSQGLSDQETWAATRDYGAVLPCRIG
jgi:alpha-ribazole phosphatase/probable phosphoglycerate mutase